MVFTVSCKMLLNIFSKLLLLMEDFSPSGGGSRLCVSRAPSSGRKLDTRLGKSRKPEGQPWRFQGPVSLRPLTPPGVLITEDVGGYVDRMDSYCRAVGFRRPA